MKRNIACLAAAAAILLPTLSTLSGCGSYHADIVLKVYNWAEYIDEGGEDSYEWDIILEDHRGGRPLDDRALRGMVSDGA